MADTSTAIDAEISTNPVNVTDNINNTPKAPESPAVSPALDLRNIQALLVAGIFPGQMAPQVCKSYQLLEDMAKKIENDSKETK